MSRDAPRFLHRLPGVPRRRSAELARLRARAGAEGPALPRLEIPIRETPPESAACAAVFARGRGLARQEAWPALDEALRAADLAVSLTPGGVPEARLLCDGAVSDLVASAAEAVARGDAAGARSAVQGFTGPLGATTDAPMRALLAASAHLAVARLWRAAAASRPDTACAAAARDLLETAHLLLRPHDPEALGSAALAAARCAAIEVLPRPRPRLARAYEALIAAAPGCAEHLRAYGRDLAPARFGTWPDLDRAARRVALLTAGQWHHGGYTWVWLDALARQPEGFTFVEAELFVAGLHDILGAGAERTRGHGPDTRTADRAPDTPADQHLANLLAAWCAALPDAPGAPGAGAPARARIAGCLEWIATDHLREIHPQLWVGSASAGAVPDDDALREAGTAAARDALSHVFAHQLARGRSVIFTDEGLALQPAGCASCTLAPCAALAYPRLNLRDEDPPCLT